MPYVLKSMRRYPAQFLELREHNDDVAVVFPEHSPEVFRRVGHWTLGGNVSFAESITLRRQRL